MDTVTELHAEGQAAIFGDASNQGVLEQAGVGRASHLVVTLPNASHRAAVVTASRSLSESVRIVVRARYLREREELERAEFPPPSSRKPKPPSRWPGWFWQILAELLEIVRRSYRDPESVN